MKKILLVGLILAVAGIFGVSRSVYCASEELGTQPGRLSIGLEESYIFEREMNPDFMDVPSEFDVSAKVKDLGRTKLRVGYQLSRNLNVYTKLGVTNDGGELDLTIKGPTGDDPKGSVTFKEEAEYELESAFIWALGFKLMFPLRNNWMVGADAQYLTHENDSSGKMKVRFYDSAGDLLPAYSIDESTDDAGTFTISEWHIAPFVAKDFGKVVPYLGVKYSQLEIEPEDGDSIDAEENVGIFVGANFKLNERFYLNLEGRFIDETAASLAAMCAF